MVRDGQCLGERLSRLSWDEVIAIREELLLCEYNFRINFERALVIIDDEMSRRAE